MNLKQSLSQTKTEALSTARSTQITITWVNDTDFYLDDCEVVVSDDDGTPGVVTATAFFGLMQPRNSATQYVYLPTGAEKVASKFTFNGEVYPNFGLGDNVEEITITIGE